MKRYLCVRRCYWGPTPNEHQLWEVGDVYEGDAKPNRHFEPTTKSPAQAGASRAEILIERIKEMGLWEKKMERWSDSQLQHYYDVESARLEKDTYMEKTQESHIERPPAEKTETKTAKKG